MNRHARIIAAVATVVIAVAVILLLNISKLRYIAQEHEWPPRHEGEVSLMPEELLVEVVNDPVPMSPKREDAAPAKLPEKQRNHSTPAPATGHDSKDQGKAGDAPSTVTTKTPSPVKEKVKEQPEKTGPSKEELEAQRLEEVRRQANSATASAFQRSQGKNNTEASGKNDSDSGSPNGKSQSFNGSGTGTVGGGWRLPNYAKVPATTTGSIKLKVTIDQTGKVTRVENDGGTAPAATDSRLRQAVINEVKSRRFTRPDNSTAPETATAYITYIFK